MVNRKAARKATQEARARRQQNPEPEPPTPPEEDLPEDFLFTPEEFRTLQAQGYTRHGVYLLGPLEQNWTAPFPGPTAYHPEPLQMHHLFRSPTDMVESHVRLYTCNCPICSLDTWEARRITCIQQISSANTTQRDILNIMGHMTVYAHLSLYNVFSLHPLQLVECFQELFQPSTPNAEGLYHPHFRFWIYYAPLTQLTAYYNEDPERSRAYRRYCSYPRTLAAFTPPAAATAPAGPNQPSPFAHLEPIPREALEEDNNPLRAIIIAMFRDGGATRVRLPTEDLYILPGSTISDLTPSGRERVFQPTSLEDDLQAMRTEPVTQSPSPPDLSEDDDHEAGATPMDED